MVYRKDKLNTVNEDGEVIGVEERGRIHGEGLLHREIHVWFYTPDGKVLFQLRGENVDTYPNLLDVTVGGHLEIGDDYVDAAAREVEEETGVKVKPEKLESLGVLHTTSHDPVTGNTNNLLKGTFAYKFEGDVSDLVPESGDKSQGFEAWPIETILNISEKDRPRFIQAIFEPIFQDVLRKIKKLLD